MRRLIAFVAVVGVLVGLPACSNKDKQEKELRAAIHRTQHLANRFQYAVTTPASKLDINGIMEDDFRVKARVAVDGAEAYDEVINDDTLAVRFADVARIAKTVMPGQAADIGATTDLKGVTVGDALKARRWVVDDSGAPLVTAAASADAIVGQDPLLDALTVLDYVDLATTQAIQVKRYNRDALDPVYNSSEDTFPRPEKGSGVDRYDFRRPPLPQVAFANRGGDTAFPKTANFRRMAVYVKNGYVIAVREEVDLRGKGLDDFVKYERALLKEAKLPESVRKDYEKLVTSTPKNELGLQLLQFLNFGLHQSGLPEIVIRSMSLSLSNLGGHLSVDLPTDNVIRGSLSALVLARHANAQETSSSASASSGNASSSAAASSDSTATSTP